MAADKRSTERYTVPVGGGGVLGRIGRMIVTVLTFGFVFPNAFVEGMNATDIDNSYVITGESTQK